MSTNYRIIEVEDKYSLGNKAIEIIEEISSRCSPEDAYFEYFDNKIKAHIRTLDLVNFKNEIKVITKKYGLEGKGNPFPKLIESIEKIGSYGIKGKKRIFVDYDKERKVKDRVDKEKKRGVYFYAQDHSFERENTELPHTFLNQIVCGDSEVVLKDLPDNCVDLVFTSPPYNFGLEYNTTEDGFSWQKYFDKLFRIFDQCIRVLKFGGRIIINIQPLFSDYIPSHHIISNFFMDRKLIWKGEILWEKNNYNCKYTAWGSWKSPSNPYLKYTWEFLEIFIKGTLKKEGKKENIDISSDEFKKWVVGKWSIAPERDMGKYGHPAMFPEELVFRVLKLFSYKNDVILDPFNGVGSTTVVARALKRKYLGIDISEEYCQKARDRIKATFF
jgi:DNA modification methylase